MSDRPVERPQSPPREIWIHALGAKVGGGVSYLRAVIPELAAQLEGAGVRVVLLVPTPLEGFDPPDWFEVRCLPRAARSLLSRLVFDQAVLPLWIGNRRGAVLYCSGSFSPLIKCVPTVSLLRNALYFDREFQALESRTRRLKLKLQAGLIVRGARGCAVLHYPSQAMRSLVEAEYPSLRGIGSVNSYGINEVFLRRRAVRGESSPRAGPVSFLYVMTYTLHKNLYYLLHALAQAKQEGLPVRVVVTSDLKSARAVLMRPDHAYIRRHGLIESGYLVPVGSKHGAALLDLYEAADACVFPSLSESFGHPLVEAMALGKPLICADRPYAREICGAHALYVDPEDPTAMVRTWRDWPGSMADVRPMPLDELASRYSWKAHVSRLVETLLRLADNPVAGAT